jgi:hypothetical protein
MRILRPLSAALCACCLLQAALTSSEQQLIDSITPAELRAHVSFLAADALEGRDTPSKGLDVAAEYIASEFRRAGLEPAGDDGYFQTASFKGAKVRNVAAILRGSDSRLNNTWLLVSAHYDHIGTKGTGPEERIYNGANERPKRSLLFIAYYGEEKGLVGSRYYAAHPLVPLARTEADLNLEHMGRTDDTEGPSLRRLSVTGFDYSDLTDWLKAAGQETGVTVYRHAKNSDPFFARSDNQALADAGVPAHTLVAAFIFPDYHQPGDHWEKLDYDNMAAVTRTVAVALSRLADSAQTVEWNADNPKAAKYAAAAKALSAAK